MINVMATTMTITTMTATMTTMVIRLHCDVRISELHYPVAAHVPHSLYPFAPDGADVAGG